MAGNTGFQENLTRREREKAMHRQEIINAAISVFSEKGFYASTLDEIAQRAEFSKGTLYLYFQNKEDLLFTILIEPFQTWLQANQAIMTGKQPFRDELTSLFKGTGEYIFKTPQLFTLITAQEASLFKALSDENRDLLLSIKRQIKNQLLTRITKAIEKNEIRPIAKEALFGMIHGSIGSMVFNHWKCKTLSELNRHIDEYIDMVFNGIAFRKE